MEFSVENLFPLVSKETSYEEEKRHSKDVDQWLGIQFEKGEDFVELDGTVSWKSKGPDTFLTPYTECRKILEELGLANGFTLVDFGAGYGRMGHVVEALDSTAIFLGFELISTRVEEANRVAEHWGKRFRLQCQDLNASDFRVPQAEAYFLYDFGSENQILDLLEKLRTQRGHSSFQLVARGGRVRHLIQKYHPWLWAVKNPRHWENFSIYQVSDES